MSEAKLQPGATAFLDRDGTINESPPRGEYLTSPEQVRLLPGAAEAIRSLNEHPATVVVVTNQRGIALGKMSEADLRAVNARLVAELAGAGARLDGILHCPHEAGICDCRKPGPALFERATREVEGAAIEGGAMVGDTAIDVEAGRRLGLTTVRLGVAEDGDPTADHDSPDLRDAVRWLLARAEKK